MRQRDLAIGLLLLAGSFAAMFVIGVISSNTNIHLEYDRPPVLSSSVPRVEARPLNDRSGSILTGSSHGGTPTRRTYEVAVKNASGQPKRYQIVDEFFDSRGRLVRRHIFGPVEAPPYTELSARAELHIPAKEKWYVAKNQSRFEPLDR